MVGYRPLSTVHNPTPLEAAVISACDRSRGYSTMYGREECYILDMDGNLVSHTRGDEYTCPCLGHHTLWFESQASHISIRHRNTCDSKLKGGTERRNMQFRAPQPCVHIHSHPSDLHVRKGARQTREYIREHGFLLSSPASAQDFICKPTCVRFPTCMRFHVITADGLLFTYQRKSDEWPTPELLQLYNEEEDRRDIDIDSILKRMFECEARPEEINMTCAEAKFALQVQIFHELNFDIKCSMERLFPYPKKIMF